MIAEPYKDDPNEGNTCHLEDPLCYDRSIYTHLKPKPSIYHLLIGAITQAWAAIASHLPTYIDFSEMTFKDVKEAFKDFRESLMIFATSKLLKGAPVYSEVDAYIEWRHDRYFQNFIWLWNVLDTLAWGAPLANRALGEYSIPAVARRAMGLSHLGVVLITMASMNLFLPPPTKSETGLPMMAYFAYGLFSSAVQMTLVAIGDVGTIFVWPDLAVAAVNAIIWIICCGRSKYKFVNTKAAIIEIARRDYGALKYSFFAEVQRRYQKELGDGCPMKVEEEKVYIVHNLDSHSSSSLEELEMKPEAEVARSTLSSLWSSVIRHTWTKFREFVPGGWKFRTATSTGEPESQGPDTHQPQAQGNDSQR